MTLFSKKPFAMQSAAKPSDAKLANRMRVMDVFRKQDNVSVNDISEETGISRQTIKKSIADFEAKGLIRSEGKGAPKLEGGPRPELFSFASPLHILCVSIEGDYCNVCITNLKNKVIANARQNVEDSTLEQFIQYVYASWQLLSKQAGITMKDLYGVIVGCDGLVDRLEGILIIRAKGLHWGTNINMREHMQQLFPNILIFVEQAVKMAGVAEIVDDDTALVGKRILTIYTDTGISACYIDNRNPQDTISIEVGELGHAMVDPNDPEECGCGSHGCLEVLVEGKRIRHLLKEYGVCEEPDKGHILDWVFAKANDGDEVACKAVDYIANMFFYAIRNYVTMVRVDTLVFQGTFAQAGTYFFTKLEEFLRERPYHMPQQAPSVICDKRPLSDILKLGLSTTVSSFFFENPELYMVDGQ